MTVTNNTVWHTKNGEELTLPEMSSNHIRNIRKLQMRRVNESQEAITAHFTHEGSFLPEHAFMTLSKHVIKCQEWVDACEAELTRRGETWE